MSDQEEARRDEDLAEMARQFIAMKSAAERAAMTRGEFIGQTVEVEKAVDDVLYAFFEVPQAKRLMFKSAVLGHPSYGLKAKVEALDEVLRYLDLREPFKPLLGDLDAIASFRNRFAHDDLRMTAAEAEKDEPTFDLVRYKRGRPDPTPISRSIMVEALKRIHHALADLFMLDTHLTYGMDLDQLRASFPAHWRRSE